MEAKLEEQYQVFGLSNGIVSEPSTEVQTARHGGEEGEVVGNLCGHTRLLMPKYLLNAFWAPAYFVNKWYFRN